MGENSTEEYVEGLDQDSSPGNQSKCTFVFAVKVLRFASLRGNRSLHEAREYLLTISPIVVAAFLWGDTRHVAGQAYEALDGGDFEGWYPRNKTELDSLNKWSDILRSWCDARDGVCAYDTTATVNYTYHWNYLDLYSTDAADWLSIKLGEKENTTATATASSSSSKATASSTSTGDGE